MALSKPPVQDRLVIGQHYLVCDNENCNKNVQFYCNPCHRSMCEQCEEEHQKNPETKKHEVVPYRQRKYQLPVEKCKDHPTKDIDMFCEDCQIPVCSKCATQNHHKHALNDLETIYSEKFTLCLEEIFKIHQYFLPTSQNIQKDVKEDVKDLKTTMNKIRTSMRDEAETLKNLIDTATSDNLEQVNKVEELLKEKLQSQDKTYQDYSSYLEDLVNEFNSYLSSKKVKNNPLIFSFSEHVNIQPIPETSKPIPPVFTAGQYSKEDVIKLLGRVTVPDTKSKIRKIKPTEIASTKLKSKERKEEREKSDVKQTLSPPLCVTKVREYTVPGVKSVHHVSFDESGRFWYSEWNGWNIVQTDQQGRMLLDIKTSGEFGYHTVTKDGDFIFTDKNKKVINGITLDNTVTEFIKTGDWEPICIYSSHINGDLLVGMIKDGEAKVIRYTKTGKEIQNIQRDTNNQELYSNPRYLTENINSNICISDWNKRAVVVVNKSGQHRFSYNGQTSWFCPWGICTDKIGHILLCDCPILNNLFMFFNSTVHLLDQDGQLLSLLLTPQHGINYPRSLCVDDDNNIHVGQRFTNKVTVYKYLQSGNIYRDQLGQRPSADKVVSGGEIKNPITAGKQIEDNGNRFTAQSTPTESLKQVRGALIDIMRVPTVSSASHNVFAYRFKSNDGTIHEGADNDGEHGTGRALLRSLIDNEQLNVTVVVSRWYGSKIGARRFVHIKDVGFSAVKIINTDSK